MRRAARTDSNHREIAQAFRKLGFAVVSLHKVGEGVPDLLCSREAETFLAEVKTAKGRPTEAQEAFSKDWKGRIYTVRTAADVDAVAKLERDISRRAGVMLMNEIHN